MKKTFISIVLGTILLVGLGSCNSKKTDNGTNWQANGDSITASFNYTPAEPVNGKKKAIVELGATGFNMFIVEVDKDKNWKALKKEFGRSLISENMTNAETIKKKLQDYIKEMVDSGVDGRNIHFVVSSGATKKPVIGSITSALKKIGYFVNVVTPEQEAACAWKSAMVKGYEDKAFVVDLGSGNTKVAYYSEGKMKTTETYGAKYFQDKVSDQTAYDDAKAKVSDIPSANCSTLFLIGGVPFDMANAQKKGDERYTVLSTKMSEYAQVAEKKGDKMKAGLNICKAIFKQTGAKQVVFDWDANFAIGFLLNLDY